MQKCLLKVVLNNLECEGLTADLLFNQISLAVYFLVYLVLVGVLVLDLLDIDR